MDDLSYPRHGHHAYERHVLNDAESHLDGSYNAEVAHDCKGCHYDDIQQIVVEHLQIV